MNSNTSTNKGKQFKHFVHSPFQISSDKVTVEVDKLGRAKITEDHDKEEFSTIECSAALINNISRILKSIERMQLKLEIDRNRIRLVQNHNDDTFEEVTMNSELIINASKVLISTRDIVFKDEPFKGDPDD
jgi:hypothetical protein